MNLRRIHKTIFMALLLTVLVGLQGVFALTLRQTSLENLTTSSGLVVVGKVADIRYEWETPGSKAIHTLLTIDVAEFVKGSEATQITVRQLGGQIGEYGDIVAGTPKYEIGDEVVLFLQPHRGSYWIHSIALGSFVVVTENDGQKYVLNDLRGINLVSENNNPVSAEDALTRMPMDDFVRQVSAYVSR